jgi:hypothetical protein
MWGALGYLRRVPGNVLALWVVRTFYLLKKCPQYGTIGLALVHASTLHWYLICMWCIVVCWSESGGRACTFFEGFQKTESQKLLAKVPWVVTSVGSSINFWRLNVRSMGLVSTFEDWMLEVHSSNSIKFWSLFWTCLMTFSRGWVT